MSDEIRTAIRSFIVENFLFGDDSHPLSADLSLIDNDMINSTGILELVGFLEERFGIAIADSDIVPANLDTIEKITAFIQRKQTV